jgi:hypothetical protein
MRCVLIEQQRRDEETTQDEKNVDSEITATKKMINESDSGEPLWGQNFEVTS